MSYYNGYVRCVSKLAHTDCYTVGKVYRIYDGTLFADNGDVVTRCLQSFEQLQKFSTSTWEELELVTGQEYFTGDLVLVIDHRDTNWHALGAMDHFMNAVCEITDVWKFDLDSELYYTLNNESWTFKATSFVGKLVPKGLYQKLKRVNPSKKWTHNEIKKARNLVTEYVKMLASQRKTLMFYARKNTVDCDMISINLDSGINIKTVRSAYAECNRRDVFNEDIGMCVAACKVLNKPIPDFILNK